MTGGGDAASVPTLHRPGAGDHRPALAVEARGERQPLVSADQARRARRAHPDHLNDVADLIRTAGDHARRAAALLAEAEQLLQPSEGDR